MDHMGTWCVLKENVPDSKQASGCLWSFINATIGMHMVPYACSWDQQIRNALFRMRGFVTMVHTCIKNPSLDSNKVCNDAQKDS